MNTDALQLAPVAAAVGASTSEPDGAIARSSTDNVPIIARTGVWRQFGQTVRNTDSATGHEIYAGPTDPSTLYTVNDGDLWIN